MILEVLRLYKILITYLKMREEFIVVKIHSHEEADKSKKEVTCRKIIV